MKNLEFYGNSEFGYYLEYNNTNVKLVLEKYWTIDIDNKKEKLNSYNEFNTKEECFHFLKGIFLGLYKEDFSFEFLEVPDYERCHTCEYDHQYDLNDDEVIAKSNKLHEQSDMLDSPCQRWTDKPTEASIEGEKSWYMTEEQS